MNRQQALKCLVDNFATWPHDELPGEISGLWSWGGLIGSIKLYSLCDEASITKQDWLDAKAEKEENMVNSNEGDKKCGCTGCNNVATHTWSGHATCNGCSIRPHLKNLTDKAFGQPYMPKVGEECEYDSKGAPVVKNKNFNIDEHCIVDTWTDGDRLIVIANSTIFDNAVLVVKNHRSQQISSIIPKYVRPLKTEREKFVERAKSINRKLTIGANEEQMLNAFFDEGMTFND